jgi:hypothetical protein
MASTQKLVGSLVGRIGQMRGAAVVEAKWVPAEVVVPRMVVAPAEAVSPLPRERWSSTAATCGSDSIGPLCSDVIQKTK